MGTELELGYYRSPGLLIAFHLSSYLLHLSALTRGICFSALSGEFCRLNLNASGYTGSTSALISSTLCMRRVKDVRSVSRAEARLKLT